MLLIVETSLSLHVMRLLSIDDVNTLIESTAALPKPDTIDVDEENNRRQSSTHDMLYYSVYLAYQVDAEFVG
jgi:hypothetical protein